MIALFLTTVISCKQAYGLIQRIQTNRIIDETTKNELIAEFRQTIPTCPVIIKSDGK